MASAALTSLLASAASNPQLRSQARSLGLAAAKGTLRAIRRRRSSRATAGRRVLFPRLGRYQRSGTTTRVEAQPGAYNQTSNTVGRGQTITKCERCKFGVNAEADDGGQLINFAINPKDPDVFPTLSGMIGNYTQWKVQRLNFEYRPSTGTQNDGVVTMGWDSQPHNNGEDDFQDPSVVASLPNNAIGNVRTKCAIDIGPSALKYVTVPDDTAADALNYYHGHFAMTTQGPDKDNVGELYVNYSIQLLQPKLNTTPHAAAGYIDGTFPVDSSLFLTGSINSAGIHVASNRPLAMLTFGHVSGGPTTSVDKDGVTLASTTSVDAVSGRGISFTHLGTCHAQNLIELNTTATAGGWLIFECPATHLHHLQNLLDQ